MVCQSDAGSAITSGGGFSYYNAAPKFQTKAISSYFSNVVPRPVQSYAYPYVPTNRGYPDVAAAGNLYGKWPGTAYFSLSLFIIYYC